MQNMIVLSVAVSLWLVPMTSVAKVEMYSGTIHVEKASGKACRKLPNSLAIELVVDKSDGIKGYFEGDLISTGRFSGSNPEKLSVSYPYQDEKKATGHFISISSDGNQLKGVLRDRHLDEDLDDCNFDEGKLSLQRVKDDQLAIRRFKRTSAMFEGQLVRSQAIELVRRGQNDAALPLFENALKIVDSVAEPGSALVSPFLTSLANSYMRAGRHKDFNRLYEERFSALKDEGVKIIFKGHRVRLLIDEGKAALGREDFSMALSKFQEAYRLHPQGREAIAGVMTANIRAGKDEAAIDFLEQAMKDPENKYLEKDLRAALAMVWSQKAKKELKENRLEQAEILLRKAIGHDPDTVAYQVALARLRHRMGGVSDAEGILEKALQHFKDEPSRQELAAAMAKIKMTETILSKIKRKVD